MDTAPEIQIIATGSSSFDLSNRIKEPMTGRAWEYYLHPLYIREIFSSEFDIKTALETRIIYGSYPEAVNNPTDAQDILRNIYKSSLYKDALEYQGVKNPEVVEKLLVALALQVGQEVSYSELSNLLGVDIKTIYSYMRILESAFVIFRHLALSRNLRKEISKSRKVYFWDNGIRNAVINNFNSLSHRTDIGQMWENWLVAERQKANAIFGKTPNCFFWRTWSKEEVDYIEEEGGGFDAFEIKWDKIRKNPPKKWTETYPNSKWMGVSKSNFLSFLP